MIHQGVTFSYIPESIFVPFYYLDMEPTYEMSFEREVEEITQLVKNIRDVYAFDKIRHDNLTLNQISELIKNH